MNENTIGKNNEIQYPCCYLIIFATLKHGSLGSYAVLPHDQPRQTQTLVGLSIYIKA